MRIFYIGEYWEPPVIAYLCMGILFSTFKIYVKKLHPFKSASLYFSVFIGIKWLVGYYLTLQYFTQEAYYISVRTFNWAISYGSLPEIVLFNTGLI